MDTQLIVTIICSCLASSGLWALISKLIERKDARGKMIVGLGHDRIIWLGMKYIERGWISHTEYENLENRIISELERIARLVIVPEEEEEEEEET